VPAMAYANRLGWKSVVIRIATGAFQLFSACALIFVGVAAWCNNDISHSSMRFAIAPTLSLPFVAIAFMLTAISYFCWFFSEFFYMCFTVVLATESGDWKSMLQRSLDLARSSFWRGSHFAFLIEFVTSIAPVLFSPVLLFSLSAGLTGGLDGFADSSPPVWMSLADDGISFLVLLLFAPFVAILNAYFANDVRMRYQARFDRADST